MIVLDTHVISELMKAAPDPMVRNWLKGQKAEVFCLSAVTVAEIGFGLDRRPPGRRRADLHARFERFAEALTVLPLDEAAAREAGRFRALRMAAGLTAQPSDMMIAGIVAVAGATLATRDVRDFEGLPIPLQDPWRQA
jgi:predicted nucleic acid-binding protein